MDLLSVKIHNVPECPRFTSFLAFQMPNIELKLFSVSSFWSQTNSEKLIVTLNEIASFQTEDEILFGNNFDIDFRQVFKYLKGYAR